MMRHTTHESQSRRPARPNGTRVPAAVTAVLITVALVLGSSGCALFARPDDGPGENGSGGLPTFEGFAVLDPADLEDPVIIAWFEACRLVPGVHVATFDAENTYILAARGEKPTAGFDVRLSAVTRGQEGVSLTFATTDPTGPVAQVVSFPVALILMTGRPETIAEVSSTGSESLPWPAPSPANAFLVPVTPLPGDVVTELTLRLAGWARCFEATYQYCLEHGHNVLAEGFDTATAGGPEWGRFDIEIEFERPTSPGLTLRLFEYSAEDGRVINEVIIPLIWGG